MGTTIFLVILGAIVLWLILTYNRLVTLRNRINNAWSQIDVQLRRRYDLIPNLVETVKGYAAHEREVFEKVTEARSAAISAGSVGEQGKAENTLTQALRSVFAVSENYPELKASDNFKQLQEELAGTESKIAFARQAYNDSVLEYSNLRQAFPADIIANTFGFAPHEYFEMDAAAREPVKVQF